MWFMTLSIALRALARNKMRAFLTMLGIIIGVGAVIAMVAIGEGAKATIQRADRQSGNQRAHRAAGLLESGWCSRRFWQR